MDTFAPRSYHKHFSFYGYLLLPFQSCADVLQVHVSGFNASYGGQEAYAWTITFMEVTGDVEELVINATNITSGDISILERVKVRKIPTLGNVIAVFADETFGCRLISCNSTCSCLELLHQGCTPLPLRDRCRYKVVGSFFLFIKRDCIHPLVFNDRSENVRSRSPTDWVPSDSVVWCRRTITSLTSLC